MVFTGWWRSLCHEERSTGKIKLDLTVDLHNTYWFGFETFLQFTYVIHTLMWNYCTYLFMIYYIWLLTFQLFLSFVILLDHNELHIITDRFNAGVYICMGVLHIFFHYFQRNVALCANHSHLDLQSIYYISYLFPSWQQSQATNYHYQAGTLFLIFKKQLAFLEGLFNNKCNPRQNWIWDLLCLKYVVFQYVN